MTAKSGLLCDPNPPYSIILCAPAYSMILIAPLVVSTVTDSGELLTIGCVTVLEEEDGGVAETPAVGVFGGNKVDCA